MPNDLSIEQIDQHTNVMPSVLDLHIRQIADDEAFGFLLIELSVQDMFLLYSLCLLRKSKINFLACS